MADKVIQVVVIGDRFEGFCCRTNVYTVSAFVNAARSGGFADPDTTFEVVIGQGVTTYETELIEHTLVRFGCSTVHVTRHPQMKLVPRHLVHKCDPTNVLVANLERLDNESFRAALRIHNNNELLIDHQTGQHIQGMVIVEATRQMFLAVCEEFLTPPISQSYYHVIDMMDTRFKSFLFPLASEIHLEVNDAKDATARHTFDVTVTITQGETTCAETHVVFTAFDSALITPKETARADRALAAAVADHRTLVAQA